MMRVELARRIHADTRFAEVPQLAKPLFQQGLHAGSKYREVWIRDTSSVIDYVLQVASAEQVREALRMFFEFQQDDGSIIDGYVPSEGHSIAHNRISCDAYPDLVGHKNTVVTDQESSLLIAVARYVKYTLDVSFLAEHVRGMTIQDRMLQATYYLNKQRTDPRYRLIWGATTADWGDIQPETVPGVLMDENSHLAINLYNNALYVQALDELTKLLGPLHCSYHELRSTRRVLIEQIRRHLWDAKRDKFRCHIYLDRGSPFPDSFDEEAIYYHGGTAVAAQAGVMTREEIGRAYRRMQANVQAAGAHSVGMIFYPPYPEGCFASPNMQPWIYGNGGDYTWWGGRVVLALLQHGYVAEAYEAVSPMIDRVIRDGDFNEWYDRDGQPRGATHFRGAAGMLALACQVLQRYANTWLIASN